MAGVITYNEDDDKKTPLYIYRATSGGTVFSANLKDETAFDIFSDSAVVDDAIYFGNTYSFSNLSFNIGTALAGVDVVLI